MRDRVKVLDEHGYVEMIERWGTDVDGGNRQAGKVKGAESLTRDYAAAWTIRLSDLQEELEALYRDGLAHGVPKELARGAMTVFWHSTMRATGNLRGWLSFLTLRDDSRAQLEIQMYAREVHDVVRREFPRTCALFDETRSRRGEGS